MMVRALVLAVSLLLVGSPSSAQQPDDLSRLMDTFSALWQRGDAGRLAELSAGSGVELEVQGHAMGPLTGRRTAAALRHLFGAQQTVAVRSGEPSRIPGADHLAFGELTWEVRAVGARMTERSTVFIGFVREGETWKISQIRILP